MCCPEAWALDDDGAQVRLCFDGVDAAFYCWVNGQLLGYSQDSRLQAEFDATAALLRNGEENTLAVQVIQFCDGSYLEDQDQWWLSGIYRDVSLHYMPASRLVDYRLRTHLESEPHMQPHTGVWMAAVAQLEVCAQVQHRGKLPLGSSVEVRVRHRPFLALHGSLGVVQ